MERLDGVAAERVGKMITIIVPLCRSIFEIHDAINQLTDFFTVHRKAR
jgi:hypothetical protein